ncbi:GIY-YIG nuclease family protein [Shewanella psychrotolerans]|uniref:GIY-YIG nuclease family protein n=1 Tax=Shewanella psychrotolerans TaxID=2864206 RepID=UPI001C65AB96|nr:GIY-YIG nuclease family protein [Shewanella psychrotolerans]QYK01459.1 GIY-YIG nuclease family protein [Shewanella psychrotolerans]
MPITEKPWFLYIIECCQGQLYTGITTDIERRFKEHQLSGPKAAKFLRGKAPLRLVYRESVGNHSQALKREVAVKKLKKQQKLALIQNDANSHTLKRVD